jgi:tellurite resistance protein TehA-like permease
VTLRPIPKPSEVDRLYFIAIITGIVAGLTFWFVVARWVVYAVIRAEERHPRLAGTRAMRVGEIVACSAVVLATVAFAIWIGRLIVEK